MLQQPQPPPPATATPTDRLLTAIGPSLSSVSRRSSLASITPLGPSLSTPPPPRPILYPPYQCLAPLHPSTATPGSIGALAVAARCSFRRAGHPALFGDYCIPQHSRRRWVTSRLTYVSTLCLHPYTSTPPSSTHCEISLDGSTARSTSELDALHNSHATHGRIPELDRLYLPCRLVPALAHAPTLALDHGMLASAVVQMLLPAPSIASS